MKTTIFSVSVALFIAARAGVVHCLCSGQSITQELTQCLKGFNQATDFTSGGFSIVKLKTFCATEADSEIQCTEHLIKRCRSASRDVRDILDKAMNVNAFRGTVSTVCDANNTAALEAGEDCLATHQAEVGSCVFRARATFNSELQSLKIEVISRSRGVEWFKEKAFEKLCNMVTKINRCQDKFGIFCGQDIEVIFTAIKEAITPPMCSAGPAETSYKPTVATHSTTPAMSSTGARGTIWSKGNGRANTPPVGSAGAPGISWLVVTTLAFLVIVREKLSSIAA